MNIDGAMVSGIMIPVLFTIFYFKYWIKYKKIYYLTIADLIFIGVILGMFIDSFPLHQYKFGYISEPYIVTLILFAFYLGMRANFKEFIKNKYINLHFKSLKQNKRDKKYQEAMMNRVTQSKIKFPKTNSTKQTKEVK